MKKLIVKLTSVILSVALLFALSVPAFAATEKPFEDSLYYNQGDYSIHYRVIPAVGEEKGNILFLHGFLYSGESFMPMAKNMSNAGYNCVVADLPSFGYSTRESESVEAIDREELMAGLMQSIAPLDTWVIAGQSMGGGVALNIACEYPEIKALLLYAPAPINEVSPAMASMANSKLSSMAFNSILKIMLKLNTLVKVMMYFATMNKDYTNSYDLSVLTKPLAVEGTADGLIYMALRARATDYDALAKLEMPILLVRGDKDNVVSASMGSKMDSALVGAEKVTVVGGGHMINETHCDELSASAIEFLDNI